MAVSYRNYNDELMGIADYSNVKSLKSLYGRLYWLESLAETGDAVAASIAIDLKTALYHPDVLTDRQRACIIGRVVEQDTFKNLEYELTMNKSTIHYQVNIGLKRLQSILESGRLYD